MSTNVFGRYFVSYRRRSPRIEEVALLRRELNLRGIPTWIDTADLRLKPTYKELRRTLRDEDTAGALLYMSPEIEADENGEPSTVIRELEVPEILERAQHDPEFLTVLIVGGGLSYKDTDRIYGPAVALANLRGLNALQTNSAELSRSDAVAIARRIVDERLRAIATVVPRGDPLRVTVDTRVNQALSEHVALALNSNECFEGRHCAGGLWAEELIPALIDVRRSLIANAAERPLVASGFLALPAALLLGAVFSRTGGVAVQWLQRTNGGEQLWGFDGTVANMGQVELLVEERDLSGSDIVLMISATQGVQVDVNALLRQLPSIRAVVDVQWKGSRLNGAGAIAVADSARAGLTQARKRLRASGTIHAFLAVPAGLAMLIGQNLNTLLPLQCYEYDPDANPRYCPAFLLRESAIA